MLSGHIDVETAVSLVRARPTNQNMKDKLKGTGTDNSILIRMA